MIGWLSQRSPSTLDVPLENNCLGYQEACLCQNNWNVEIKMRKNYRSAKLDWLIVTLVSVGFSYLNLSFSESSVLTTLRTCYWRSLHVETWGYPQSSLLAILGSTKCAVTIQLFTCSYGLWDNLQWKPWKSQGDAHSVQSGVKPTFLLYLPVLCNGF